MKVKHVELARSRGLGLSQIVAGTMTWGEWGQDYSPRKFAGMIDACLERGITSFDLADIYGHYSTEETFGKGLAELGATAREGVQLITKCGINLVTKRRPQFRVKAYDSSRAHILASVDKSLVNLQTEYLDLLLLHRPDPLMEPAEVAEAFQELRDSGKVRYFGVSNFTPRQFDYLDAAFPLATNQVECHPLHPDPIFDGTFDQLAALGRRPMVWSPLGGNKYFKSETTSVLRLRHEVRTIAERHDGVGEDVILLAWLLRHPAGPLPVIGTTRKKRIRAVTEALDLELSRQDWFAILEAARGREVA